LQSSLLRFEREGLLAPDSLLPVQNYQLLDVCGFQVEEPKAVEYDSWRDSRVKILRPAPLEPLMIDAALEFQTPQKFLGKVLEKLFLPGTDAASRGNFLDVAVAVQMSQLSRDARKLRPWLCSLCNCTDADLPGWIAADTTFGFRSAVEFNQALWRYFASIPVPDGPPDIVRQLLDGIPPFPYPVDEVALPSPDFPPLLTLSLIRCLCDLR
jgi:hypothetical protein